MKSDMNYDPLTPRSGSESRHADRVSGSYGEDRRVDGVDGRSNDCPASVECPEALITITCGPSGLAFGLEGAVRLRWAWTTVERGEWVHWKLRLRGGNAR